VVCKLRQTIEVTAAEGERIVLVALLPKLEQPLGALPVVLEKRVDVGPLP